MESFLRANGDPFLRGDNSDDDNVINPETTKKSATAAPQARKKKAPPAWKKRAGPPAWKKKSAPVAAANKTKKKFVPQKTTLHKFFKGDGAKKLAIQRKKQAAAHQKNLDRRAAAVALAAAADKTAATTTTRAPPRPQQAYAVAPTAKQPDGYQSEDEAEFEF